ncbi:MAG: carbon-nitrogen hydrolase family protein [Cyclobacteriaceae bacterium]
MQILFRKYWIENRKPLFYKNYFTLNKTDMIKHKFGLSILINILLSVGLTVLSCNSSYAISGKGELDPYQDRISVPDSSRKTLKIGMAQFTHDTNTFEQNRDIIFSMIDEAKAQGCEMVIFDEWAQNDPYEKASKAEFDEFINMLKAKAVEKGMFILCGIYYRESDNPVRYHQRALVINSSGEQESFYRKYIEIPKPFYIKDIACHTLLCADRWSLEMADLFCLVGNSQVIFDLSGGHGGDDGRPSLRWIRYRPWAQRTNAFVVVANPPHHNEDFMGNNPWGGHSAIFNPDGSFVAQAGFENDTLIVTTINAGSATLSKSIERRNNVALKPFWDAGKNILEGNVPAVKAYKEFISPVTTVKVAAVQMVCSRTVSENVLTMSGYIKEAAQNGSNLVVFPELAVTGAKPEDIRKATEADLNAALKAIQQKATENKITVIFGMPFLEKNRQRKNSAWVIGPDGKLLTRYDQIASSNESLFVPGHTAKTMWFRINGAYATVTVGQDADYQELTILAAAKGTQMHIHIANENGSDLEAELISQQKYLNLLAPANFGVIVNAAQPENAYAANNSMATGGSMFGVKAGGHNKSDPGGVENYFPYTASILLSAEKKEEILYSAHTTTQMNKYETGRNNRRKSTMPEWYEWIKTGVHVISPD